MLNILEIILWVIAIIMLIGGGLYYTLSLNFIQFKFNDMFKGFRNSNNSNISPFKGLTMSLAARIGVGSLAGISLAIYMGGVGSIFWIWISSIITSSNAFVETLLGLKYKVIDNDTYKGGPSFYIDKGLNNKNLAKTYALIIIFAYIFGFMTIQANTISKSICSYINIKPIVIGIVLSIISFLSIMKGVKEIAKITSFLVPVMGFIYIILSLLIIITNLSVIPDILLNIINSAFNFKSFGFGIISSFVIGIQRGVFSTEAGLGSGAIATSTIDTNNFVSMGLIQVLGIYFTCFVICTSTAFIVLTSNYTSLNLTSINGIEITQYALNYHLGNFGDLILIFSIISFAFSTIISGYYYGESNFKYLFKNIGEKHILVLKIVSSILLILGSVVNSTFLWKIVDIFVAIMAIINMYSILKLRNIVKNEVNKVKV